jgi:hypothetical protein
MDKLARKCVQLQALCVLLLMTLACRTEVPSTSIYRVGDVASIDDTVSIMVLGWDKMAVNETRLEAGTWVVVVDVIVVNQGNSWIPLAPDLQVGLESNQSPAYDIYWDAWRPRHLCSGSCVIGPGERVRFQVGFLVPESDAGLVFTVDGSYWNAGRHSVELGAEPVRTEVPSILPGEQVQKRFSVGDICKIDDLRVSIDEVLYAPDDANRPDGGSVSVVVDVIFENEGGAIVTVDGSDRKVYLKDETGQLYEMSSMFLTTLDGGEPGCAIAPGERVWGQIGFQVSGGNTELVFVFEDRHNLDKVFIALPR